jgi:S1-C subfamily serine protease
MSEIGDLGRAIGAIAERVGPSVVAIGERWRGGAGVVIAQDRVVTNAHNVGEEGATVTFADGRAEQARLLGADEDGDLAVLEVSTGSTPVLAPGADEDPVIGTPVVALGRAGDGGTRVTLGFVSSVGRAFRGPRGRRVSGAIEHTAPLMPGSSGGPIVDTDGRLLGVNTNRLGNGFYLALPTDAALMERLAALGRGETPSRRHLGVGLAPGHAARRLRRAVGLPERDGVLVRFVEDDSPAASAGIQQGDLIVAVGDHAITDADDLFEALGGDGPLAITLVRGTDERTVEVPA